MRLEYYINIMIENLDFATLNLSIFKMEEISDFLDID